MSTYSAHFYHPIHCEDLETIFKGADLDLDLDLKVKLDLDLDLDLNIAGFAHHCLESYIFCKLNFAR